MGLMATMQLRITGYPTYSKNKVFIFSKETNLTDKGCGSGVSFSLFIGTGLGREVLLFHFVLSNQLKLYSSFICFLGVPLSIFVARWVLVPF